MRIDSIQIEGFGIFTGIVLDALPARFILLHGENGAGKSTLLDFIRSVLFGPEQGAGARKYPPLRGAAHRGDLIVETSAGDRYRVQRGFTDRGPGRVDVLPVPPTSRVVDLATILGSTTRRLYTRVFGFSLDELQDTQSLSDGEIAARFYSIGGGVGSRCQADIAVRLSQDLSSLFKPRGRDPKINAAIRQIDDTQKRLKEAAGGIVAYRHCSEERRVIDARLDGQRTQLQELQRDLDRANLCSSAWDTWVQLGIHRRTLAALPVLETFPDSGLARLENADADRSRCHQMCDDLEAQRTALLAKKSSVHRDAQILSHSSAIEACWAESNRYRDVLEEHPRRTLELEGSRRDLNGALQRLGPGWDLARVQRFDTGLAMLATVQQFRDTITSLRRAREEAEVLAENAAGQAAEAEAALDRDRRAIASRWSPTPAETSVLDERTRNIRRTRDLLRIKAELQRDLTTAEAANTEAQQNRERMQRALDSIPTSTGMPILWTVPAAALLAGGCFYRTPPVLIAFGFLAAVASIVSWIVRRRIDPRAALDRAAAGSDLAEAVQKLNSVPKGYPPSETRRLNARRI